MHPFQSYKENGLLFKGRYANPKKAYFAFLSCHAWFPGKWN